jgi:hypothetical protein
MGMMDTEGARGDEPPAALELVRRFAQRTGLYGERTPDRYLWTDAFAVCTFLGLGEAELGLRLVDQVHRTLGRHRPDDPRRGWISGLADEQADEHPTQGGLRIGKRLPERGERESPDDELEWDRDGQYFHYLTRWMHALDQATRFTGDPVFNRWGRELAAVAHRAFTWGPTGARRMYWKMSIDMSRPLVTAMGHHDPLDGYLTCLELEATASQASAAEKAPDLAPAISDFAAMIPPDLTTADPLGIGGLLVDASRLVRLGLSIDRPPHGLGPLLGRLVDATVVGLEMYAATGELRRSAASRLAFRELGLAIGLAAVPLVVDGAAQSVDARRLRAFVPLRDEIEEFWLRPEHRRSRTWVEHRNINDVMLATSLAPDGYLAVTPSSIARPGIEHASPATE